jgi:uncharacterized damage-inducible protein DinB
MDARALLTQVDKDLGLYLDKIRHCVSLLDDAQLWWRANPRSNSVGNLVLHLCGNLSQWVLAGIGGRPYERHRSAEFSADRTATGAELLERLTGVVAGCREVVAALTEAELAAPRTIQGYPTDGQRALLHAWEHMAYHTGQIVLIAKQLVDERTEVEFYPQHKRE